MFAWRAKYLFRRNKFVHEGVFTHPNQLVEEMLALRKEHAQIHQTEIPNSAAIIEAAIKWTPPPLEWCKVNWDVAFKTEVQRVGVGILVRDHNGRVLAARSFTKRGVMEPTIGETIASYHAAQFCNQMGLQKVILEGDAKTVVEAINGKNRKWSNIEHLVDDTRVALQSFIQWKCVHVKLYANMVAHKLAKLATTDIIDRLWDSRIPDCISDVILMEQVASSSD